MSTAAAIDPTDTVEDAAEETLEAPQPLTHEARLQQASSLVRKHAMAAAGIGLIPMPVVDFAALTALQLNLLRKLSSTYDVRFAEEIGKKAVASLLAGYAPVAFAMPAASLIKSIPLIGQTTGVLAMSALAGATTYAVGKVFIQHFESGGTFLNFDPTAVREYYREQFKEGREVVADGKKSD